MAKNAITVAVIDSGWPFGLQHARVLKGVGFDPGSDLASEDCYDRIGHGLCCADILLSTAPSAVVIPVRIFGDRLETSIDTLCRGLSWAASSGVDLISLSVGTRERDYRRPLEKLVHGICDLGIPVVSAAGPTGDVMPAVFDGVIGVGGLQTHCEPPVIIRRHARVQVHAHTWHPRVMHLGGHRAPRRGVSLATAYVAGLIACLPRSVIAGGIEAILDALNAAWGAADTPGRQAAVRQRQPRHQRERLGEGDAL